MGDEILLCRRYGETGRTVVLLHGGPGAVGYMAPVGRKLGESFRVLEPWQRRRSDKRLTVAAHVADLHKFLTTECAGEQVAIVGSSWGAMLALAFTAEHQKIVSSLVLIGSGTFDRASRKRMHALIEDRMTDDVRERVAAIKRDVADEDERLRQTGEAILPVYAHDPVTTDLEIDHCDAKGHVETWSDMVRLQETGKYPAAFTRINCPVLMLHGAEDVHPGEMIRANLSTVIPHLEYIEWPKCGHYPWIERRVSDTFYNSITTWLLKNIV